MTRSDEFRYRWSVHNVRHHRTGVKRLHHPDLGDLEFSYQAMALPERPDRFRFAFAVEPGSSTEERLRLLGSLDRAEVFIETKLWISDYGCDEAMHGCEKSAGKLGLDQIDLLLLHQPLTADFDRTIGA